jgi:hypothetical protein
MPVLHDKPTLDGRYDLTQVGNMAVRKNVTINPWISRPGSGLRADGMQQKDSPGLQKTRDGIEKDAVIFLPDMLEHTNRNNFFVLAGE